MHIFILRHTCIQDRQTHRLINIINQGEACSPQKMFLDYIHSSLFTAQLEWKDLSPPLTIPSIPKHKPTDRRNNLKKKKEHIQNQPRRKVKSKLKWKKMKLRRRQIKKQNLKRKDSRRFKKSKEPTSIEIHLDSREQTKAKTNVYGRHIIE